MYQHAFHLSIVSFSKSICRQFTSEDPAPPLSSSLLRRTSPSGTSYGDADVPALAKTLLDPSLSLFVRYRALFTLRNIGTPAAIDALSSALLSPNEVCSPLFKHEVAFVFGQMSDPHSVPALIKALEDDREAEMVRHEAAEALGGIATEEVLPILRQWAGKEDAPRVIRESCVVAIDMWEVSTSSYLQLDPFLLVYQYENSNQFQYADGLDKAGLAQAAA